MTGNNGKAPSVTKHQLVIESPTKDTPGFLRIQKRALAISKAFRNENPDPNLVDNMVEFLLDYVTQPIDRDEAREAIWDCTQRQWEGMLSSILGRNVGDEVATEIIPPVSSGD